MAQKVILNGYLGNDPELTYPNGKDKDPVVNFSIATTEKWKDRKTGEKKEKTEWHRCFAWRKKAEIYAQHMKKGEKYYIEGKLETSQYEVGGRIHYSTKIKVDLVEF